jgi:F-type H+-transporting ATPase subunit gamma
VPQGLKEIRRRIRTVQSIHKITSAMKLVAASNLRRAEQRARAARPYAEAIGDILAAVSKEAGSVRQPLLERRPVKTTAYVVITADRGLCGGYNAAVLRRLQELRAAAPAQTAVVAVGRRGRDYCERRRLPLLAAFAPVGDHPREFQARAVSEAVTEAFVAGRVDEVVLVSTRYLSATNSRPVDRRLLPVEAPEEAAGSGGRHPHEYEPDPDTVLRELLPVYLHSLIYQAMLESKAAEQGARMNAMDNATRNSEELERRYTLTLNRLRQAAITTEIAELVGGAAAIS